MEGESVRTRKAFCLRHPGHAFFPIVYWRDDQVEVEDKQDDWQNIITENCYLITMRKNVKSFKGKRIFYKFYKYCILF